MKVAINGDIIETNNIYKIDKINSGFGTNEENMGDLFSFKIHFFNKKSLSIQLSWFEDSITGLKTRPGIVPNFNELYHRKEEFSKNALDKITKLRMDLVFMWQGDKSEIKQLNF